MSTASDCNWSERPDYKVAEKLVGEIVGMFIFSFSLFSLQSAGYPVLPGIASAIPAHWLTCWKLAGFRKKFAGLQIGLKIDKEYSGLKSGIESRDRIEG